MQKDQAGWKESKPAVTFPGIGLQIILLLLRLDYIILVITKTSITENGREYNEAELNHWSDIEVNRLKKNKEVVPKTYLYIYRRG